MNEIHNIYGKIIRESLLIEGRLEDVKKKYPGNDKLIDLVSENDPSGNNKYLAWIIKHVLGLGNDEKIPMVDSIISAVGYFHQNQQSFTKKDINQYKSVKELNDAIEEVKEKKNEKIAKKQSDKVYEDNEWLVVAPKSWEASCTYGSGTKWCVASKNQRSYWDDYFRKSDFYFIINKSKTKDDPLYKVAVRKFRRGKYELWDATDYQLHRFKRETYISSLPKELLNSIELRHDTLYPNKDEISLSDNPKEQALMNLLDIGNVDDIDDEGYHWEMESFSYEGVNYAVGEDNDINDSLWAYYEEEYNEYGLEIVYMPEYYISMPDIDGFADDMAEQYVMDLDDSDILEYSDLQSKYDDLESEIYDLNYERDQLEYEAEDARLDGEDEMYEELEVEISNMEDRIFNLESNMEDLIEEGKEIVKNTEFDRWYECLEDDPINCLIEIHGLYNDTQDMVDNGVIEVDEDSLINDLVSDADWSVLGEYEETEDDEGNTYYVFEY